jgi:aspartyl-tRNA(Asn)/glutamyl-tRNA(Gln) amidotransferase subunit A
MCLGALGTQTVGSLTRPASFCGVCSYKPSDGAIPADGILPLAPTLDHVGVMARCVTDLAILAGALIDDFAGRSSIDQDMLESCPLRFVAPDGVFAAPAEPAMAESLSRVRDLIGPAMLEGREWPVAAGEFQRHLRDILAREAAAIHGDRLRRHPDDYPTRIRDLIDEGLRVPLAAYHAALEHRAAMQDMIESFFIRSGACLMTPATPGPAPDRSTTGDGVFNAPWSYTGTPTVSLPIGRTVGELPLAVQLIGSRGTSTLGLFASAAWLERQLGYDTCFPPAPETITGRDL